MVHLEWSVFFSLLSVSMLIFIYCSGEVEFLDVWHEAYAAIMRYSRGADGFWVRISS